MLWGSLGLSFDVLWVTLAPLGRPLGPFGVPVGSLWGRFGRFGTTWAARGCRRAPKDAGKQKAFVFVCFSLMGPKALQVLPKWPKHTPAQRS